MMDLVATLNKLCTPAFVYAVVHLFFLGLRVLAVLQRGTLFRSEIMSMLILHAIVIAVFAFLLNRLCKAGYPQVSWIVVLLPFLLMLINSRRTVDLSDPNLLSGLM